MRTILISTLAPIVATGLLAACGGDDASTLERAEARLAELERGAVQLTVTAQAGGSGATTGEVGYTLEGVFDTSGDTALPLLDLRYTRVLGSDEQAFEVVSDGSRMAVVEDGVVTEVPAAEADTLRLGNTADGGPVDGLSLEQWLVEPQESEGPDTDGVATRRIVGSADPVAVLADLSVMMAQVGGGAAPPELDDAAAERIRAAMVDSAAEVLVGDDEVPRSLTLSMDFSGQPPAELADVLGALADVRLAVALTISQPNHEIPTPTLPE